MEGGKTGVASGLRGYGFKRILKVCAVATKDPHPKPPNGAAGHHVDGDIAYKVACQTGLK